MSARRPRVKAGALATTETGAGPELGVCADLMCADLSALSLAGGTVVDTGGGSSNFLKGLMAALTPTATTATAADAIADLLTTADTMDSSTRTCTLTSTLSKLSTMEEAIEAKLKNSLSEQEKSRLETALEDVKARWQQTMALLNQTQDGLEEAMNCAKRQKVGDLKERTERISANVIAGGVLADERDMDDDSRSLVYGNVATNLMRRSAELAKQIVEQKKVVDLQNAQLAMLERAVATTKHTTDTMNLKVSEGGPREGEGMVQYGTDVRTQLTENQQLVTSAEVAEQTQRAASKAAEEALGRLVDEKTRIDLVRDTLVQAVLAQKAAMLFLQLRHPPQQVGQRRLLPL